MEGLTQAEFSPGLGEECGAARPTPSQTRCSVPRVRETAFTGGGGPCSLIGFFNLAPKFTQDNIFIFHISLESGGKEILHRARPSSCLVMEQNSLPPPHKKAAVIY